MKNYYLFTLILLISLSSAFAQVPQSFKYQAVARNSEGNAISNTNIGVKISIIADNVSGPVVYSEAFTPQSNTVGIFNVNIGTGSVLSGNFPGIDWGADEYFLSVAIDIAGGTNYTEMGTSQLLSVPYSMYTSSIYVHYSGDTLYIGDQYVIITGGGGTSGTVFDIDGNEYETVTIGDQIWLKSNLKVQHYSDGTPIQEVYAYDDNESNIASYGRLYTWNAAMGIGKAQGACMDGWHLPSKAEVDVLIAYLGGAYDAGGKMKETGFTYWNDPNMNANNESGFSGRGAGYKGQTGNYEAMKNLGAFWTSDENGDKATRLALYHDIPNAFTGDFFKTIGYSIRCIKD